MMSLILSRNICLGLTVGPGIRILTSLDSPEKTDPVSFALFVAALFGYWLFSRAITQARAEKDGAR